jgi:hypothetical protein
MGGGTEGKRWGAHPHVYLSHLLPQTTTCMSRAPCLCASSTHESNASKDALLPTSKTGQERKISTHQSCVLCPRLLGARGALEAACRAIEVLIDRYTASAARGAREAGRYEVWRSELYRGLLPERHGRIHCVLQSTQQRPPNPRSLLLLGGCRPLLI